MAMERGRALAQSKGRASRASADHYARIRKRPHFEASLLVQNRTKFRHFLPKRGRIWHKIVFHDRFSIQRARPCGSGAIPTSAEHKPPGEPKAPQVPAIPCRWHSQDFTSRSLVGYRYG